MGVSFSLAGNRFAIGQMSSRASGRCFPSDHHHLVRYGGIAGMQYL
ncbi:hypothetical protein BHAOGJBA_2359 [Methylobacterium hispanicum]|jgi:hypothetical protein|uniref:Uncharacterized protein n=1 Tax=Methylobacterium hispanicum TaxID=270350 RepID=A0AAV4ZKK1_9HYPH|nr:hypothetical protein BHAOGJBA_2359 [Methylobacterium hispanicum]